MSRRGRPVSPRSDEIARLLRAGWRTGRIARELGVGKSTVLRVRGEIGLG